MMDKSILEQYIGIKNEERDLIRRIQSIDARLLNMETSMIVSDTVTRGKKGKQSLGTIRIEGFPSRDYQRRKRTLRKYKQLLADKDDELLDLQVKVEKYIETIDDSYIRQIIRCKYIDGMTWNQIAKNIHTTPDSARMALTRFLEVD
jgi:hypothetical protein